VDQLHLGETVTLLGAQGSPVAVLVSLKPDPTKGKTAADWLKGWDELAKEIGRAWKSDKSAVETVIEMRR
jgi:antitoxin (DNA-binding transcriptional repressor) of toxin-antitoxin stability system